MNTKYLLDTNIASYIIKGHSLIIEEKLLKVPMESIFISAITEAELLRGITKKTEDKRLQLIVKEFLLCVETLVWDSDAAHAYANLRRICDQEGKQLGTMDILIASHSLAVEAVLITNDKAFYQLKNYLKLEDWTH